MTFNLSREYIIDTKQKKSETIIQNNSDIEIKKEKLNIDESQNNESNLLELNKNELNSELERSRGDSLLMESKSKRNSISD